MALLHSFKTYFLTAWHCFKYEEFSREFNRQSLCLKHLPFSFSNNMVYCLALHTHETVGSQVSKRFLCSTAALCSLLHGCKIVEWENHAVLLSLSVFNWLSANPEPFFFSWNRKKFSSIFQVQVSLLQDSRYFQDNAIQVYLEKSSVEKVPRCTVGIRSIQDPLVRLNLGHITGTWSRFG